MAGQPLKACMPKICSLSSAMQVKLHLFIQCQNGMGSDPKLELG